MGTVYQTANDVAMRPPAKAARSPASAEVKRLLSAQLFLAA